MSENKTQVICDTSVWYDLGDGSLICNKGCDCHLIVTSISIHELTNTPNIIDDFMKVKLACKAIKMYADGFIFEHPMKHLKNLLFPDQLETSNSANFLQLMDYLINVDEIDEDILNEIERAFSYKRKELQSYFVDYISSCLELPKAVIHANSKVKNDYLKLIRMDDLQAISVQSIQKQIIGEMKSLYPSIQNEDFIPSFWREIEVFIKSRMQYMNNLKVIKNMRPKKNDSADMLNLVYVNKGRKYWVKDGRWKTIIKEAGIEDILFTN